MADDDNSARIDRAREDLLEMFLERVAEDRFPSPTMLDIVEKLLGPDDVERYLDVLMTKISDDTYPSLSHVRRILTFTDPQGSGSRRG